MADGSAPPPRITTALVLVNDKPPKAVRLLPFGNVPNGNEPLKFTKKSADLVKAEWDKRGRRFGFDYDHDGESLDILGEDRIASGWGQLEIRDDGLWITGIEWTPKAYGKISAKEFLYLSPSPIITSKGEVVDITSAALTNHPALYTPTPLLLNDRQAIAQQRKGERLAAREQQDQEAQAKKDKAAAERQRKRDVARASKERAKREVAEAARRKKEDREQRKRDREEVQRQKDVDARLRRDQQLGERNKKEPREEWWRRFHAAVKILHPALLFDERDQAEIDTAVLPLWRAHNWGPEEAAQAVCRRCGEPGKQAHAGPVASGGDFLAYKVKPKKQQGQEVRKPKPSARTSTRSCPTTSPECGYSLTGGRCSISARLSVPARGRAGAERIPARYCLVEIEDALTSNLPLQGFAPRPGYPAEAQERDYRQPNEQEKVRRIAADYDPALLFNTSPGAIDGIPIADERRRILGGNGRTMGTALVYAGQGGVSAEAPKDFLLENAEEFGFSPDDVRKFKQPMLLRTIRVGSDDPRMLAEWSRRLNTSLSEQLDATLLAVSRARFLTDDTLRILADGLMPDDTIAGFLGSSRSRAFVRALQQADVLDARSAATYIDGSTGLLNESGRDLVADLLVAVLLPDATLIRGYGRGPVGTLARAAPYLIIAGQSAEGYDLRAPLRKAVQDRITQRASGLTIANLLSQRDLFGGAGSGAAKVEGDARALTLLYILDALDSSPAKFARLARQYAELASDNVAGQGALFAAEKIEPLQALRLAAEQAGVQLSPGS